jgi:hypothetical protein
MCLCAYISLTQHLTHSRTHARTHSLTHSLSVCLCVCRFPGDLDLKYSAVSGFIFLRFFGPAVLGPKLFGLRAEFGDATVSRTLTLAAKVLQVRACTHTPTTQG